MKLRYFKQMTQKSKLFDHPDIELHKMEDVPLDRDIFLMGDEWMAEYSIAMLKGIAGGDWDNVGYISYACARSVSADGIELSWYPNIYDRFHEVRVNLPRRHFVACTEMWQYDEKPRIFVSAQWLEDLHLRVFSVFALVDVIGVRRALLNGSITKEKLAALQGRIDAISANHTDVSFVSFADSLLLKTNWTVGQWDRPIKYTYEPEKIIKLMPELVKAYKDELGLSIYAVVTQGQNEFYEDSLIHKSSSGNHISLNSLGLPFAQLQSIESAAKHASKTGVHQFSELYMDVSFFKSLKMKHDFKKDHIQQYPYVPPMADYPCQYVLGTFDMVISNLQIEA
ncbi:hypothetical protein [Sphingomonas montanisoli]|uniref:Uncharacterized protein n=1 Tax=Sphingomonas montanisoli TaxID=2606412 RepID=A0A5D9CDC4_9SPHN|nr:hypothetical protein [Sphingomonas montanisoli]TZG29337.1 hypothetical protein FYJ91_04225 [Sphingomonas montanisoli]